MRYLFLFVLLAPIFGFCQNYEYSLNTIELDVVGESKRGYQTLFSFEEKKVRNAFWNYCKLIGKTTNQRSHYVLEVPTDDGKRIIIYGVASAAGLYETNFSLLLEDTGVPQANMKKYLGQVGAFLVAFKQHVYLTHFDEEIAELEKKAERLSIKYVKEKKSAPSLESPWLAEIEIINAQIESLRSRQIEVVTRG